MVPNHKPGVTAGEKKMIGTANQVDWAEQIKVRVSAEFDRVARALASAAAKQTEEDRIDTLAVIAILEDKRAEVIAKDQAGYFIHDWQICSPSLPDSCNPDAHICRLSFQP